MQKSQVNVKLKRDQTAAATFFLLDLDLDLDLLLRSESDELSSLVSMNSLLLKLSLPPRSRSFSPPADFRFLSSCLMVFFFSLIKTRYHIRRLRPLVWKLNNNQSITMTYFLGLALAPPPLSLYSFFALSYCLFASPALVSHSLGLQKQQSAIKMRNMKWTRLE